MFYFHISRPFPSVLRKTGKTECTTEYTKVYKSLLTKLFFELLNRIYEDVIQKPKIY